MSKSLKLIAQDAKDIEVVSSLLQDMTVRIGDIAWLPSEKRLAFVGNRFRWEKKGWFRRPKGERVRTAAHFDSVSATQIHDLNLKHTETVLELLNISVHENGAAFQVVLNFSGGASIKLDTDSLDLVVTDTGESWDAIERPRHDLSDAAF
jgi:hypothetical protein